MNGKDEEKEEKKKKKKRNERAQDKVAISSNEDTTLRFQ